MAEATTYQNIAREEKARARASIREMLDEMDRLHQENQQRQERIDLMDKEIDQVWPTSTPFWRVSLPIDVQEHRRHFSETAFSHAGYA